MFTVKIKAHFKGLVFKNNRLVNVLNEGRYWLMPGQVAEQHPVAEPFRSEHDLNMLLQSESFASSIELEDVLQNEISLLFRDGLFKSVLLPGKHAFWKGYCQYRFVRINLADYRVSDDIDRNLLNRPELAPYVRVFVVEAYEKALMFVDGNFNKLLEPGIYYFWKNATAITVYKSDTRAVQSELNGQEILTKDKANLRINFSLQYKVTDPFKTVLNKEFDKQLYVMAQLALREQIAAYSLDELLEKRDALSPSILSKLSAKAEEMGVSVMACGIRDIILPGDIKDIMNQVLIADKKAQANTIMRREETASTRSLLNTAKLMEENDMLFKLKEMEYVEKIADKINSISVSGAGDLVGQLKQIFVPPKNK